MESFDSARRTDFAVAFVIPGIVYLADAIATRSEAIVVWRISFSNVSVPRLFKGELKPGVYLVITLPPVVFPFIWLTFYASLAYAGSVVLILCQRRCDQHRSSTAIDSIRVGERSSLR